MQGMLDAVQAGTAGEYKENSADKFYNIDAYQLLTERMAQSTPREYFIYPKHFRRDDPAAPFRNFVVSHVRKRHPTTVWTKCG